MTMREEALSGCPFRKLYLSDFYCAVSPWGMEIVTGFEMCAVDWESCPNYQEKIKKDSIKIKTEKK